MTGADVPATVPVDRPGPSRRSPADRLRPMLTPQFIRFLLVGAFNSLFGYGLFALLQATLGQVWNYLVVTVISYVFAILEAFLMQRYVVFRVRARFFGDLWRFSSVYIAVLLVNLGFLPLLHGVLGMPLLLAQAIFMFLSAIATFTINRTFTFHRPAASATKAAE